MPEPLADILNCIKLKKADSNWRQYKLGSLKENWEGNKWSGRVFLCRECGSIQRKMLTLVSVTVWNGVPMPCDTENVPAEWVAIMDELTQGMMNDDNNANDNRAIDKTEGQGGESQTGQEQGGGRTGGEDEAIDGAASVQHSGAGAEQTV